MLPSTGYFKAISCPFYENGYCERPYCHFRHSRRDGASAPVVASSESSQTVPKSQNASSTSVTATHPDVIQKLVSEAVKKVLVDQNVTDSENIVNKVVEGLKPKLVPAVLSSTPATSSDISSQELTIGKHTNVPVVPITKTSPCVYNPTPIAELKKRHLPITAYEPTRESKAVKRKSIDTESPWMAVIRNATNIKEPKISYTPTAINQTSSIQNKIENYANNYVPTMKSDNLLNLYDISSSSNDSYIPEKKKKKEFYCPKPKKRKEEYVPRKPKIPLQDKQHLDDDAYDVLDELLCRSESTSNVAVNEESQDLIEVDPKFSDDDSDDVTVVEITKEEKTEAIDNKRINDEKENEKIQKDNEINHDLDKNSNQSNKEKSHRYEESSRNNKEDISKSKIKSSEKSSKIDLKQSKHKEDSKCSKNKDEESRHHKNKEDSKHNKIKTEDSKHSNKSKDEDTRYSSKSKEEDTRHSGKNKEEDTKHSSRSKEEDTRHSGKNKEEDSKHSSRSKEEDTKHSSKSKEEDAKHISKNKEEDTRHSKSKDKDKDKDKERSKDRDKRKHNSKSNDKDRSSSKSNKSKDKDKEKVKDSRGSSSHKSKKESKSDKDKSSNVKDSKVHKKENKDKSKHKSEDKDKHKSKLNSVVSKNKTDKHKNSDRSVSHSSHKSSKSNEKTSSEIEDIINEMNEKSDQDGKSDSPDYEQFSPFYDEQLFESSESDHDVEEECRKIFQEYEVTDYPKDVASKAPKPEIEEPEEIFKKRVAHPSAVSGVTKQVGPSQPPKYITNPQQRMYERWKLMKDIAAEKATERAVKALENPFSKKQSESRSFLNTDHHQVNGNGRIRIAQVPYAMSLALEKKKVLAQAAKFEVKTAAQNKKGARVAHIPQTVPQLSRPEPLQTSGTQKFPLNVRQFNVNAMQDICTQIYTNSEDAAQRAVREEFACYEKCKALLVYKNSCMLTMHRLRKEVDQKSNDDTTACYSGMISHEAVLAGKSKGSWSVVKSKKIIGDIKGVSLYNMLTKWIMTEQELKDNGFPRPHPDGPKGRAKLYVTNTRGQSTPSKVPNERFCCRCNKSFMVDKNGFPVRKENCIYHYARKFTFRGESKYMCCKQDGSSDGCCDATTHIWDYVDVENLRGYVSTFDKAGLPEEQGLYALDCEMCYTTQGLELTRVTVINEDIQVVYESLVKPAHPIVDYNTRFSGITAEDMKNVTTSLLEVQATLLSMFSSKTILIGHSLESDFKALKLLHNTVVDTSVIFPHKNGPPFKRALKNLCSEYLRKIIQDDVGGHDSKEDASACMELVLWKVKEEAKLQ